MTPRALLALVLVAGVARADDPASMPASLPGTLPPTVDSVAEGEPIAVIAVVGNTKTADSVVEVIADVQVGEKYTEKLLARIRTDLETSGLFQEVRVWVEHGRSGGVRLVLYTKDKHSWIIAPTFYTSPGNYGGGLGFAENNLLGLNKKLLVYAQVATLDTFLLLGFYDPHVPHTKLYYQIYVYLRRTNSTEYDVPNAILSQPTSVRQSQVDYWNGGFSIGAYLWRGFQLDGRLRGAWVAYRDAKYEKGIDPTASGLPSVAQTPEDDGRDFSTLWRFARDTRTSWDGVWRGQLLRLTFEKSLPLLSSYNYWILGFSYVQYLKFLKMQNLMIHASADLGWHLPYQQEFTAGGTDLRGYTSSQFRGDFQLENTLEYSLHLFWLGPFAFRGLGFWDSAYTSFVNDAGNTQRRYLPGETDDKVSRWRNGVGGGIRVYAKSIILPLLGVDVGYGIEARDYHIYLAVGLTNL